MAIWYYVALTSMVMKEINKSLLATMEYMVETHKLLGLSRVAFATSINPQVSIIMNLAEQMNAHEMYWNAVNEIIELIPKDE